MLVVLLLLLYPVMSSIFYSFTNKNLIKPAYSFVGFENYAKILTDPVFWAAFWTNIKWTAASLLGQLLVGFTGALALNRIRHAAGVYRTCLIIPWAFPSIVLAFSWKWILNGVSGFLPNFLVQVGLCATPPQFLSSAGLVFPTLVFVNIWFGAPLIMVNILSALQTVPKDQYEAAQLDGCGYLGFFFKIVLPLSKAVIAVIALWAAVGQWNSYFNALIYIRSESLQPLQIVLRSILVGNQTMSAMSTGAAAVEAKQMADLIKYAIIVVSTAPIMCMYPLVQKYFNQGVMLGSLKG